MLVRDFIAKLPGINSKNIYGILNQADSLQDLLEMSEAKLSEILGSKQNATELYQALHGEIALPSLEEKKQQEKKKPFKRFKSRK